LWVAARGRLQHQSRSELPGSGTIDGLPLLVIDELRRLAKLRAQGHLIFGDSEIPWLGKTGDANTEKLGYHWGY